MQVSGEALKNQLEVSEKKLTEKEQQYVIQWQKLAFRIANKFIRTCNINPDSFFADHILSAAVTAMVRSAQGFDESRGLCFGTYMGRVVYDRIKKELNLASRRGFRFAPTGKDLKIGVVDEHSAHVFNDDRWTTEEQTEILRLIDLHRDEMTADIARRHFFEDQPLDDIAADLGISLIDVKQSLRSLRKCKPLQKAMQKEYEAIIQS